MVLFFVAPGGKRIFYLFKILHWHLNYARSSLNPCVSHDVFISDICHKELRLMMLLFDLHYVLFLSPDEKYILTGGEEDLVTVWSMEDRKVVAWGEGHNSWVQFQQNFVHINWVLPPSLFSFIITHGNLTPYSLNVCRLVVWLLTHIGHHQVQMTQKKILSTVLVLWVRYLLFFPSLPPQKSMLRSHS